MKKIQNNSEWAATQAVLKIAQIVYTGFGGLGSVAFSLVEADAERRHDWMIGFIGDQPIDPSYPRRCAANSVAWQAFQSTAGRPYSAWFRLARWLEAKQPNAVILHSINSILPCRWSCWRRGAPLVVVEHTSNAVKTRSEWAASRLSMLLSDRVVLLTEQYRDELSQQHGPLFRPGKTTIIPNGIDTTLFRPPTGRPQDPGTVRLGMAARFSFTKRQDLLVEMIRALRKARPRVQWELRLAGDGDRLESVRRSIAAAGLAGVVRLDGRLDEAQVADWMRGLDIYVHASDGETLSTSVLQAMATGLPIVASDVPGIRNLLGIDRGIGVLAPNEARRFADAIIRLVEDDAVRTRLEVRARRICIETYGRGVMLERYLEVICSTIKPHSVAGAAGRCTRRLNAPDKYMRRPQMLRDPQWRVRSNVAFSRFAMATGMRFGGKPPAAEDECDPRQSVIRTTRNGCIALFLPSLEGGGAERVFVNLANQFVAWGRSVDLVLAQATGPYMADVDARVRVVNLAAPAKATIVSVLSRYLRRERPAVLVSAMDVYNVVALVARRLAIGSIPVVVTCHVPISGHASLGGRLRDRLLPRLTRMAYASAAGIIAVSEGVAHDLSHSSKISRETVDVIYNPVVTPDLEARAREPLDHSWFAPNSPPVVVSAGRLSAQKDFPTLLRAFARLQCPARLIILGEGPGRPSLEALIRELGVVDTVAMPGFVDNPFAYLSRARLFVLCSVWEGFGLVLVEALACGCPVISTDCPSGPSEILDGGRFGTLVEAGNVGAIATAIEAALERDVDHEALKARAADFAVAPIARRYLEILDRCMAGG